MLFRIRSNVQGCCCHPQAEILQAQQCSAEGFGGDRAGGEHGSGPTAGSIPLLVEVLRLFVDSSFTRRWDRQFSLLQLLLNCICKRSNIVLSLK